MSEDKAELERLRDENAVLRVYSDQLLDEIDAMKSDWQKIKDYELMMELIRRHREREALIQRPPRLPPRPSG